MEGFFDFVEKNFGKMVIAYGVFAIAWVCFVVWAVYSLVSWVISQ